MNANITFTVNSTQRDATRSESYEYFLPSDNTDVNLIIGPPWNFMVASTISTTWDRGMLFLGSGSSFSGLAMDDSVFRLTVPDDKEGQVLAEILNNRGYESAVILVDSDLLVVKCRIFSKTHFQGSHTLLSITHVMKTIQYLYLLQTTY